MDGIDIQLVALDYIVGLASGYGCPFGRGTFFVIFPSPQEVADHPGMVWVWGEGAGVNRSASSPSALLSGATSFAFTHRK